MTKSDFISARRKFKREISWFCVAILFLWFPLSYPVFHHDWFLRTSKLVAALLLGAWALIPLVSMWFLSKFLHQKHNLVCPSCHEWLIWPDSIENTGKCPKCQAQIFHLS
jgi:hypothetical protein